MLYGYRGSFSEKKNKLNFFHGLFSMAATFTDRGMESGELKANVAISVRKSMLCVFCAKACVCMCALSSFFKETRITRTRTCSFQRYYADFFSKNNYISSTASPPWPPLLWRKRWRGIETNVIVIVQKVYVTYLPCVYVYACMYARVSLFFKGDTIYQIHYAFNAIDCILILQERHSRVLGNK